MTNGQVDRPARSSFKESSAAVSSSRFGGLLRGRTTAALNAKGATMSRMPSAVAQKQPAFEQFAAIRRYQPALAFSPDGESIAYSTNISGQFNLWRQPSAGGYPRQLTLSASQSVRNLKWSPD